MRESFEVNDLLSVQSEIEKDFHNLPLPSSQLAVSILLLKLAFDMITGAGAECSSTEQPPFPPAATNNYSEWLFLPDRQGILTRAGLLTCDDAPWISNSLSSRNSTIMFVHKDFSLAESRLFGVRSLRDQLFSGDDIVCPSAKVVSQMIAEDSILHAMLDLLAMADHLKCSSCTITLDERTHASESLMHPALAEVQGLSMLIHMEGVLLTTEEVIKLLTKTECIPMLRQPSQSDKKTDEDPRSKYPTTGKRLLSSFVITDVLQVLSGSAYFIFDPCGAYLLSEESGGVDDPKHTNTSRAQKCDLGSRDILSKFPDQFSPLLSNALSSGGGVVEVFRGLKGTILRLPLRSLPSTVSPVTYTLDAARSVVNSLTHCIEGNEEYIVSLYNTAVIYIPHPLPSSSPLFPLITLCLFRIIAIRKLSHEDISTDLVCWL